MLDEEDNQVSEKVNFTSVEEFLDLLPKVKSHYCWSCSCKLYLEPIGVATEIYLKNFYEEISIHEFGNFQLPKRPM